MKNVSSVLFACVLCVTAGVGAAFAAEDADRRARLEAELAQVEAEIAIQQQLLDKKRGERRSLERDVAVLDAQIKKAQLAIRRRNLSIRELAREIAEHEEAIRALDEKLAREKMSLAQLVRRTNEIDELSLVELVLGSDNIGDVFSDVDRFRVINVALSESFLQIGEMRALMSAQKRALEEKRMEENELRRLQVLERSAVEKRKKEKARLISATKGQERRYQTLIREKEQTAAEIRAALFALRDTAAIPFGDAYAFAKEASAATGVRPALILAILAEESNLGENVGTGNWKDDMHPTRDRPVFSYIVKTLGLNPDTVPVSRKPWYGWGGAMGPAQFIPSTWVCYGGFVNTVTGDCGNTKRSLAWKEFWKGPWEYRSSKDRLRRLMKANTPSNPWDPRTAIFAAATLMMDNGADAGTRAAERLAALRYFAGWRNAKKPSYAFYGDEVMELADRFQRQIDILER